MTRHPRQPLDAEERALAALLPRPHGRGEPGPDLDARILAAAQAAVYPQAASRRKHRGWIAPTAVAASLVLAVGLALAGRILGKNSIPRLALPAQAAINFAVGVAVLVAALVWTGQDGRMLTYAALVLACASSQWLMLRAWRG